ncbi:MAG: phosphate-starvation-inducible PsiE family protein [Litoricolaceae bacterium]|nr:phosphate-starvation-inducible PsiE family protein [Litorivicinaceae bacterium]
MERWVDKLFEAGEKILLVIIATLTLIAVALELMTLGTELKLELADLLLLFIYLEVFGMAVVYYRAQTLPVTLPVLIAITGITRLIILQGKDFEPSILLFEAGAIFLLAIAYGVLTWANSKSQKLKPFIADED